MDIKLLEEFLQLTVSLNCTTAAETLLMSRSSLSKHIKSLERELGAELFERTTKGVSLTPQGLTLQKHATAIMQEYNALLHDFREDDLVSGIIRIAGCLRYPPTYRIASRTITRFNDEYPDVDILMRDTVFQDFRETIIKGVHDIVCSLRLPGLNEEGLDFLPLIEMDFCAWVPLDSPLASRESVTYEELSHFSQRCLNIDGIEPGKSTVYTSFCRSIFEKRNLSPKIGKQLSISFHMEKDEFCIFPLITEAEAMKPRVEQIPIENPEKAFLCWIIKHNTVNPAAKLFFESAKKWHEQNNIV